MSNPYQSPTFDPKQFQDQPAYVPAAASDDGWVKQVRLFAILNAVQGTLEILMGLLLVGTGAMFGTLFTMEKAKGQGGQQFGPMESALVTGLYVGLGLPVLISGVLRIVAGWKNYRFRGRTLGMVSIIVGLGTMFSCYCAPTAVGLLVYGLILFVNPAVKAAFQMAKQGRSPEQILAAFNPYQPTYYAPAGASPFAGGSMPNERPPADG